MSFLTPLYLLGLFALSLPVIFHLIRQTPQGRQTFSSLMFLSPSPPRVTRRSRIDHWLLLLLRALVLALLAFAFARPLWRREGDLQIARAPARRVALLVDTSASMRRGDLWPQAMQQVRELVEEASPADEIALYTFDRDVRPQLGFSEWKELPVSQRAAVLLQRLQTLGPTWHATELGEAIVETANLLVDAGDEQANGARPTPQLVLISDLQQGSHLEALQAFEWPDALRLSLRSLTPAQPTNASLTMLADRVDTEDAANADDRLRIRVSNEATSQREEFLLRWQSSDPKAPLADPIPVYVPPGSSRVVRVAWPMPETKADRLVLSGDDQPFDNALYLVPPRPQRVRFLFIGEETEGDTEGLLYYLRRALPETRWRTPELTVRGPGAPTSPEDFADLSGAIVAGKVEGELASRLQTYLAEGGRALLIATPGATPSQLSGRELSGWTLAEASLQNYALIGRVTFEHPLFGPFAEPRYADFTKIRFWKHRRLSLPEDASVRTLAWFDDGDPFVLEESVGAGKAIWLTSSWRPDDSQWALSTKFVPLLLNMLERSDRTPPATQYTVGDALKFPDLKTETAPQLLAPDGTPAGRSTDANRPYQADQPGIFHWQADPEGTAFAVNLAPDESRTQPLTAEDLEQRGARLGQAVTPQQWSQQQRQLRMRELENRQKLWRWLLVGVLVVLVGETAIAGRLTRRSLDSQVTS